MRNRPEIIEERMSWIAINKPSGWLTIPGRSDDSVTPVISEWIKSQVPKAFIVHRLDRETSGILLIAKDAESHRSLSGQFATRRVRKAYDTLVSGDIASVMEIDAALTYTANGKTRVGKDGKPAYTRVEPIHRFGRWTWCRVTIETGRTHQIRVHLQHVGHPVIADPIYGDGKSLDICDIKGSKAKGEVTSALIKRTALHAGRLGFEDPSTGQVIEMSAPWPKDLRAALNQMKKWLRHPN